MATRLATNGGLDVGTDGVFVKPFPVHAEPEERPQRAEPLAFRARAELPAAMENIDVARSELVKRDVAARFRETRELLREGPVLAQGRGRYPGPFPVAEENLGGIGNRNAPGLRVSGVGCTTGLPFQASATSHAAARALASSQSDLPVCLRLKFPPRVPETRMRQAHFSQPRLPSSNSHERVSSACPPSHSMRCLW